MSKLTREQIEVIVASVRSSAFENVPCATISPKELRALCDMALSSIADKEDAGRLNWLANNAYAEQVEFDSWYLAIGWEQKQWDHNPGTVTQKMFKAAIDAAMKGASHE